MANTNMDALYPEFWFSSFDALDVGRLNLQQMISRDVESLLANRGESVNVPITPDLGDADDWTPGSTITATNISQETVQVTLDKSKKKTISLNTKELSLTPYDLIEKYGTPMAKSILDAVNEAVYRELLKTNQVLAGAISADKVVDARTQLEKNRVGIQGRRLVAGPDDMGTLLKTAAFYQVNTSGDMKAQKDGIIDRKFGFDVYENSVIATYTPADVSGAVNHPTAGSYAIGTTTMAVDGIADAANPVKEGVIFTINGDTTKYSVTAVTSDTDGNTTGISFYPALVAQAANDAAITFTATRSALALVPGAAAFAARAYASLPVGILSSVINVAGVPVRVSVWADSSTMNLNVQYDVLFGVKMVNPLRVVRIDS